MRAGHAIQRAGEAPRRFYTLFSGWAFQFHTINGNRQILGFLLPGDLIGVQAPILGFVPYTTQALTDVELCVFETQDRARMQREAPFLVEELARIAAVEALTASRRLVSVGLRSAEARVAHLLLELYERLRIRGLAERGHCTLPLTLEALGDALGLSHVHVSRMLRVLTDDALIRFDRGELQILDEANLRRRALSAEDGDPLPRYLF